MHAPDSRIPRVPSSPLPPGPRGAPRWRGPSPGPARRPRRFRRAPPPGTSPRLPRPSSLPAPRPQLQVQAPRGPGARAPGAPRPVCAHTPHAAAAETRPGGTCALLARLRGDRGGLTGHAQEWGGRAPRETSACNLGARRPPSRGAARRRQLSPTPWPAWAGRPPGWPPSRHTVTTGGSGLLGAAVAGGAREPSDHPGKLRGWLREGLEGREPAAARAGRGLGEPMLCAAGGCLDTWQRGVCRKSWWSENT